MRGQLQRHIGIDEVVKHSDKPDDVASKDPELRVWDALDAGTHDDTLQDAILEHMQVRAAMCRHVGPCTRLSTPQQAYCASLAARTLAPQGCLLDAALRTPLILITAVQCVMCRRHAAERRMSVCYRGQIKGLLALQCRWRRSWDFRRMRTQ